MVADVEVPRPPLHQLPVDQRRQSGVIQVDVGDVRVAVDDRPRRRRVHLVGEHAIPVDQPLRIVDLVRDTRADRSVEVPADLVDAASRELALEAGRQPGLVRVRDVTPRREVEVASSARLSAAWSGVYGLRLSRNVAPEPPRPR